MREIARRAGVSHAAPAHHFGDKAGIFTAIAFTLEHGGQSEVMFRPELYRADDPDLTEARDAAFQLLYETARAAVAADEAADVTGLVVAGWSVSHGFATLWLHGNLEDRLGTDRDAVF